jgi:hypothetical protein
LILQDAKSASISLANLGSWILALVACLRVSEDGLHLLKPLLPLPDRVDVRVPDHMQLLFLHLTTPPPDLV